MDHRVGVCAVEKSKNMRIRWPRISEEIASRSSFLKKKIFFEFVGPKPPKKRPFWLVEKREKKNKKKEKRLPPQKKKKDKKKKNPFFQEKWD